MAADRPLRADARRNRTRLLDVAREVFAAEGLAVPIDEIARRAGVGIGTVYRHFPTKQALFEAIVLDRVERLTTAAATASADARTDPGEAFFTYLRCMIEAGAVDKAVHDTLAEAGGIDRAALTAASHNLLAALGDLLTRAQHAGAVRTDIDAADLKAIMTGSLAMLRSATGHPDRIITVISDGLRPPR